MTFNPKTIFPGTFGLLRTALFTVLSFSFLLCPWALAIASDEIPKTLEASRPFPTEELSFKEKKPKRQGGKPTIIRGKYGFPKYFQDDLSRESLRQVVKNQLDAMQEVNPDQKVRLGKLMLSKGDLKKGLTDFLQLLDLKLSPKEFSRQLKKKFYFYRGGVGKQKRILFTGYYTPVIEASRVRTAKYKYPLYTIPGHAKNIRLIGHSSRPGAKTQPPLAPDSWREFTREQIDRQGVLKQRGLEVAWLKDDLERFFLHIQGSGWLHFPDGKRIGVRYLAANNHKYKGIGKLMIADGVLKPSESSMQGIKRFLRANPQAIEKYFFQNKRYIFFTLTEEGPQGSGGGEDEERSADRRQQEQQDVPGRVVTGLRLPGFRGGDREGEEGQSQERQVGPADHGQDDGDGDVYLERGPFPGQRRRQRQPQRECGHGTDELDDPHDDGIGDAAEISRDAADNEPQGEGDRDADGADRKRNPGGVERPREYVPPYLVGAK